METKKIRTKKRPKGLNNSYSSEAETSSAFL